MFLPFEAMLRALSHARAKVVLPFSSVSVFKRLEGGKMVCTLSIGELLVQAVSPSSLRSTSDHIRQNALALNSAF